MDQPSADDPEDVRYAAARAEGQVEVLETQLAMLQAADEHRRGELAAALQEAADARAAEREWQGRLEESRRMVTELRERLAAAETALRRAEDERAAVIAALGRKARRTLGTSP